MVLAGVKWSRCLVYIDDIIVMGKSFHHHLLNLRVVMDKLREAGLKMKLSKCALFRKEVLYLDITSPVRASQRIHPKWML